MDTNRGTCAGGANTNVSGKTFEQKTENETRLLEQGFVRKTIPKCNGKYNYYLEKDNVRYMTQGGLKAYFGHFFPNLRVARSPDEAYLIQTGDTYILKILEKKNQNSAGSVDTKLLAGQGFVREYKYLLGEKFTIKYAFCLSSFLKTQYIDNSGKSEALRQINKEENIVVLFGEDADYYETLDAWISS